MAKKKNERIQLLIDLEAKPQLVFLALRLIQVLCEAGEGRTIACAISRERKVGKDVARKIRKSIDKCMKLKTHEEVIDVLKEGMKPRQDVVIKSEGKDGWTEDN